MYCDLCANRTADAYCPNRGCHKFTKQSPDEHGKKPLRWEVDEEGGTRRHGGEIRSMARRSA